LKVKIRREKRTPHSSLLTPHSSLTNSHCELVVADILNASLALKLCKDIDVIVHLAANTGVAPSVENPRMDCETNVLGTLNYLEAARHCKVPRFVFASSGAPVGEVEPPIHEELAPHPVSPYGASKLAGEGYCSAYYRTFAVETVCLRFGNVYGPLSGKKDSVIAKFIRQAMAGEAVEIYGDGTQTRDFIHVSDLVSAVRLAASIQAIGGETFQIATSREHTVNELVALLQKQLKAQKNIDMKITYGQPRVGDVKRNFSQTSKARNILGWESKKNLQKGIEDVVGWFSLEEK
jgi:UDP-glucose 4-epimerase